MQGKFIDKTMTMSVDTGGTGVIDAVSDAAVIDVLDLTNMSVYLNQITDDGTVTLVVEKTIDGTNFALVGSKSDGDFPAGANKSIEIPLSDSNGMPLRAKQIRVTATVRTGTGTYSFCVAGSQVAGYR